MIQIDSILQRKFFSFVEPTGEYVVQADESEGTAFAESSRARRDAYIVVAGSVTSPCSISQQAIAYVPNNVEPATSITANGGGSAIINGEFYLSLGASYALVQPPTGENYSLKINDVGYSDFDGSFKRIVFLNTSDPSVVANAACSLANQYNVVEYGSFMIDTSRCPKPIGAGCVIDEQCSSNS